MDWTDDEYAWANEHCPCEPENGCWPECREYSLEKARLALSAAYASVGEPVPSCSRSNGVIVCGSVPVGPTKEGKQ